MEFGETDTIHGGDSYGDSHDDADADLHQTFEQTGDGAYLDEESGAYRSEDDEFLPQLVFQ